MLAMWRIDRWPAHKIQGSAIAVAEGHERLENVARARSVTSNSSEVTLTRNTAQPHVDGVCFAYHFNRRGWPCTCPVSAHDITLREVAENPRRASYYVLNYTQYGYLMRNEDIDVNPALRQILAGSRSEFLKLGYDVRSIRSCINT